MSASEARDDRGPDDSDEGLPRPPTPPSTGAGKTAIAIVAIVGVVILGSVAMCSGVVLIIVYAAFRTANHAADKMENALQDVKGNVLIEAAQNNEGQQVAEALLQAIRENRLDAAYRMTTVAYQRRTSRAAFENYVRDHLALKDPNLVVLPKDFPAAGPRFEYVASTALLGGVRDFTLIAVKDGETWKIDELGDE